MRHLIATRKVAFCGFAGIVVALAAIIGATLAGAAINPSPVCTPH